MKITHASDANSEMTRLYELSARQGKRIAELEARVQELEADNMKLRYAWFRSADRLRGTIYCRSPLPTPPEE